MIRSFAFSRRLEAFPHNILVYIIQYTVYICRDERRRWNFVFYFF